MALRFTTMESEGDQCDTDCITQRVMICLYIYGCKHHILLTPNGVDRVLYVSLYFYYAGTTLKFMLRQHYSLYWDNSIAYTGATL